MTELVNTYKPEILLLGATTLGRDLAGSVATTLLTGLTADCTELAVDSDGSLAATRPTFGGSLLCTIYTLNYRPQMATVRPRVMPHAGAPCRATPAVSSSHPLGLRRGRHRHEGAVDSSRIANPTNRTLPTPTSWWPAAWASEAPRTTSTSRIWPTRSERNGAARARLCRRGWIPADRQIGQTGKTIRPKLYIAAGISGGDSAPRRH